jgi:hypothetical protein
MTHMKRSAAFLALLFVSLTAFSQNVNVVGALVGSGSYPTLGAAFTAINGGAQTGAIISVTITGNTTEPVTATLNQNTWLYLTISPAGGAARTVSGAIAGALVNFDGADRIGIDGLNTGGNSLTFDNTSATAATSTLQFINDARAIGVQNCTIRGSGTSTTSGVVFLSTGTVAGNDSIGLQTCTITASGVNLPVNAICSIGSATAGVENSSIQVIGCNISDYFSAASVTNGILAGVGNSDWTIQSCKLFQSASRTYTTANTHSAIQIASGNNHLVSGNTIGFASAAGTGVYTMLGTIATRFIGINLGVGSTTASSVQGNVITACSLATSSGATTINGIFCGINITSGNVNVGTVAGNTIGAATGVDAIVTQPTTSGGLLVGINTSSTGTVVVQNNTIGALTSTGTTASIAGSVAGVNVSGAAVSVTISGNTIGNTTANNMRGGNLALTTGSALATGINFASTPTTSLVSNNTIQNLAGFGTGTAGGARGIITPTVTTVGTTMTVSGNTIRDLTSNTGRTGVSSGVAAVFGIQTLGPNAATVSGNTIFNLSNTNTGTGAFVVAGILTAASNTGGGGANIFNNVVHSLSNSGTGTTATTPPVIAGIVTRSGNATTSIYNNMISLGTGITTNTSLIGIWNNHGSTPNPVLVNVYHNTVNITGTAAAGALSSFCFNRGDFAATVKTIPVDVRNNIFTNDRSGGTGQHFAISNNFGATVSSSGWGANASDFNVLNATSTTVGFWGAAMDFATWRSNSASDNSSFSGITVTYVAAATNLHLNMGATPTVIESGGATIAMVTTDIDAQVRPGPAGSVLGGALAPDIGADEIDAAPLDVAAPIISYTPLSFTCGTGDRTLTATISDAISGVPTSGGNVPRIYFRKVPGVFFNSAGTLTAGTSASGTWQFTISAATMGGLAIGDVVEYYVVAQDQVVPTANLSASPSAGFSGFNVNSVISPPTTPNSYPISGFLSGTYTVGATGVYPTLTAAVNAYNTSCLGGPVTFSLIDATYASETYPITILSNPDASATNTLTIKPASGVTASFTGSSATALVILSGADFVTLDGHNGTTVNSICPRVNASRDLTFTNTNTSTASAVFSFQTTAGGNGATRNTLMNCNIIGSGSLATGVAVNSSGPTVGAGTGANSNNYNSIINNRIQSAQVGIFSASAGAPKNIGTVINLNDLNSPAPAAIGRFGVMVLNEDSVTVHGNLIGNMSNAATNDQVGIALGTNAASNAVTTGGEVTNSSVMYNEIDSLVHTSTFSAVGILVAATASGNTMVANNMVTRIFANGTGGDFACGIYYGGGAGAMRIYHNTVDITGATLTGATQPNMAIGINGTTPTVDIRNNILMCSGSNGFNGNTGIGLAYTSTLGNYANLTSNFNDIVVSGTSSGVGRTGSLSVGTVRTALLDWQTETGRDLNSVILPHTFVSASNYHVLPIPSAALSNLGTPLVTITSDIDCDTRSATAPDMGADEWLPACVTASVGALVPGDTSFCTPDSLLMLASTYSTGSGSTYTWESSVFGAGSFSSTGGTDPDGYSTGLVSASTDYRLVVTCATDGSTAISDILTVFIGDSTVPVAVCQDITMALNPDGTGFIDAVSLDNGSSDNCTPSGSLVFSSVPDSVNCGDVGTISVTLTVADAAGNTSTCLSNVTIDAATLVTSADGTVLANGFNVSCFGGADGEATASATGGCPTYTYLWDDGQTTAVATGLAAGLHTVIITDGLGNADTVSVTLTEPATAVDASATTTDESCVPGADGSIDLTPTGGSPSYTFLWSDGAVTEDRTGLIAGTYTVTVTDTAGCTFVLFVPVNGLPGPGVPVITMSGDTMYSSITDPGYSYQWYLGGSPVGGATNPSYYTTTDGSYTLVVTDSNGCTDTSLVFLMVALQANAPQQQLELWPNPASQVAYLALQGAQGTFDLRIADMYGKVVMSRSAVRLDTPCEIDLASFAAGVYTVEVSQGFQKRMVRLVVN